MSLTRYSVAKSENFRAKSREMASKVFNCLKVIINLDYKYYFYSNFYSYKKQPKNHDSVLKFAFWEFKKYKKLTTFFSTKLKKECAAYGIVFDLWDFIRCGCMSGGPFRISNYNWTDLDIMFKGKLVQAVRATFFTN